MILQLEITESEMNEFHTMDKVNTLYQNGFWKDHLDYLRIWPWS